MFKIISDGGCDFGKTEAQQYGVDIVPFYISFDRETYLKEGVDITRAHFFKRLATEKNLYPKTSQPNPQDYIDVCRPYLEAGEDVFFLTISSKLSGSNASATIASGILKEAYPNRTIVVVDSLSGSVGQGLILREVIKMRDAGYSPERAAQCAKKILKTTRVYILLDTLEYARRGGRVGPTTAFVGGILSLRPILHLEDGQVLQLDAVRGKKQSLKLIAEALVDTLKDETDNVSISIGHIQKEDDSVVFKAGIEASLGIEIANPLAEVGATIGAHAGPGALIVAYCKKYNAA